MEKTIDRSEQYSSSDRSAGQKTDTGFKAAGGIRSCDDAIHYLDLTADVMGKHWISERHFRFGASSLLDQLLQELDDSATSDKSNPDQASQNSY